MQEIKQTRIPFIVFGDKDVRFGEGDPDTTWEVTDFNLPMNTVMRAIRGYITPGYIQFYAGPHKQACSVNPRVLDRVVQEYYVRFSSYPPAYRSGIRINGEPVRSYNLTDYYRGA